MTAAWVVSVAAAIDPHRVRRDELEIHERPFILKPDAALVLAQDAFHRLDPWTCPGQPDAFQILVGTDPLHPSVLVELHFPGGRAARVTSEVSMSAMLSMSTAGRL